MINWEISWYCFFALLLTKLRRPSSTKGWSLVLNQAIKSWTLSEQIACPTFDIKFAKKLQTKYFSRFQTRTKFAGERRPLRNPEVSVRLITGSRGTRGSTSVEVMARLRTGPSRVVVSYVDEDTLALAALGGPFMAFGPWRDSPPRSSESAAAAERRGVHRAQSLAGTGGPSTAQAAARACACRGRQAAAQATATAAVPPEPSDSYN